MHLASRTRLPCRRSKTIDLHFKTTHKTLMYNHFPRRVTHYCVVENVNLLLCIWYWRNISSRFSGKSWRNVSSVLEYALVECGLWTSDCKEFVINQFCLHNIWNRTIRNICFGKVPPHFCKRVPLCIHLRVHIHINIVLSINNVLLLYSN